MQNCTRIIVRFQCAEKFQIYCQFHQERQTSAVITSHETKKQLRQFVIVRSAWGWCCFRNFENVAAHVVPTYLIIIKGKTIPRSCIAASFRFLPGALEKSGAQLMGPFRGKGFVKKKKQQPEQNSRRWWGLESQIRAASVGQVVR